MPQRSVLSPSRLKSPAASSAFEMFSETRLNLYVPASGAVQVPAPVTGNVGPVTEVIMARQDPSLSRSGWVPVTQSTILRSPVVVVCSAGWSRSTPESMTPIVIPRPSHAGFASLKSTDPMSRVGMNGLSFGVLAPGPATAAALAVPDPPGAGLREEGTVVRAELVLLVQGLEAAGLGFRCRGWFGGGCRADGARGERGGRERGEGHARASGKGWCHRGSCRNKGWWPAGRRGAASVDHAERADPEPRTHPRPNFYPEQASALPWPSQTCPGGAGIHSADAGHEHESGLQDRHRCFAPGVTGGLQRPVNPPVSRPDATEVHLPGAVVDTAHPCRRPDGARDARVALVVDDGRAVRVEPHVQPRRLDGVPEVGAVETALTQHEHQCGRDPVGARRPDGQHPAVGGAPPGGGPGWCKPGGGGQPGGGGLVG